MVIRQEDNPLVSVIVPIYNVEKYLERCMDSIMNQSYENFEVICVNDCSPDGSREILRKYEEKWGNKITVLDNKMNMGLGKSRERGIANANGKWLLFVDSDDYISLDYIASYLEKAEEGQYDIVAGGYIRDIDGKHRRHKIAYNLNNMITYPIACAKMFRKEFLIENSIVFSDIRCGEDIYFSLQLLYYGAKIDFINYNGYYYFFNRKSITGSLSSDKNHEHNIATIYGRFLREYNIFDLPEEKRWIVEYSYISNMVNALITYGHGCGIKNMNIKYDFFINDLNDKFPEYKLNPTYSFFKQKKQLIKVRLGVAVTMFLHKFKLDRAMFLLIALA